MALDLPMFDLSGKKALVTGSSNGIGKAAALMLARAGADVAVTYHKDKDAGAAVVSEIKKFGHRAFLFQCDIADAKAAERNAAEAAEALSGLDIAVNAALRDHLSGHGVPSLDPKACEEFDFISGSALNTTFYLCRAAALQMYKSGGGKIVNLGSISGFLVQRELGQSASFNAYAASKAGVIQLTKMLAAEWREYNIRVNCVSPGYTDTRSLDGLKTASEAYNQVLNRIPIARVGSSDEVASAILFMCAPASDDCTGSHMIVDGGYHI